MIGSEETYNALHGKKINRRSFLGALGVGVGATSLSVLKLNKAFAADEVKETEPVRSGTYAILYEAEKCIGCHYCEAGCKNSNSLSNEVLLDVRALSGTVIPKAMMPIEMFINVDPVEPIVEDDRDANRWLRVTQKTLDEKSEESPDILARRSCTHCGLCAQVCPSRAITQREDGIVTMDSSLCIGCFYCYQACPFDIPRYRDEDADKAMQKCNMCSDRVDEGLKPACVSACPADALTFGDVSEITVAGRKAVADLVSAGYKDAYLYGDKELNGVGVLSVIAYSPETYGLPVLT